MRYTTLLFGLLTVANIVHPQGKRHHGGHTPVSQCIKDAQYRYVETRMADSQASRSPEDTIYFIDPMGDGGINSFGKTITNYVDHDPANALQDYTCGQITYNTHRGTDIEILNFFQMDEGVPILGTAPGEVTYTHDGEYDRHTEWISGVTANAVIVTHADGSEGWYWHMRKNSVNVEVGDSVSAGDTLGYVGSSGYSSGPHLHFEIRQNGTVDPFTGNCQPDTTRWFQQPAYVLNLPFQVMDHGLTTIPLDWAMISERPPTKIYVTAGSRIYSWLRLRNIQNQDNLTWKYYANGSLWNTYTFGPDQTYSSSWWYVYWNLPADTTLYGDWKIEVYRNDSLIAEQPFIYDGAANQLPVVPDTTLYVQSDSVVRGEFSATDPDGAIFWYQIEVAPTSGTLTQFGGRDRKFRYTPDDGFTGRDTARVYARDDENADGQPGLIIFDMTGNTGIARKPVAHMSGYRLAQNYPNPFNPTTTIRYTLPRDALVTVRVYDLQGRKVQTLVQETQDAGSYRTQWNGIDESGETMSSGVYFYRLEAGDFIRMKKMVLLR